MTFFKAMMTFGFGIMFISFMNRYKKNKIISKIVEKHSNIYLYLLIVSYTFFSLIFL